MNYELRIKGKKTIILYSLFFILFVVVLLIGITLSKSPNAGLYGLVKFLEFAFFGFYVATALRTQKNIQTITMLLSGGVLFESLLAIMQYINQGSINGIFYFFGERLFTAQTPGIANASINGELMLRPYGTFSHPNVLAGYLVIVMTLIIFNFPRLAPAWTRRGWAKREFSIFNQFAKFKKSIFICSILIGSIALFFTMSRIAILLWIGILILWIIKNLNIKNSFHPPTGRIKFQILIAIAICAFLFLSPLRFRFLGLGITDESVVVREKLIVSSLIMVKNSPFFGVGMNNFLQNLPDVQKVESQSLFIYLQPVHNIFFLIAAEIGLFGLLVFSIFMIKTILHLRKKKEFSILIIVLILGMFDHYFLTLQQGQLLFALVLGLCWAKVKT